MSSPKKTLPLLAGTALGLLIGYLFLNLKYSNEKLEAAERKAAESKVVVQEVDSGEAKEEKHWIEERIEEEGAAMEKRIREQEAQGDDLKSEFDKFAE